MAGFWEQDALVAPQNSPQGGPAPVFTAPDPIGAQERARAAREEERDVRGEQRDVDESAFRRASSLRTEFLALPDVKQFREVRNATRQIVALADRDSSAMGDIGLIFTYMKTLDPTSAVREGEQASAQNAAGVPGQIRNAYNRLISGERLSPEQRRDMAETAQTILESRAAGYNDIATIYRGLIEAEGFDPEQHGVSLFTPEQPESGPGAVPEARQAPAGIIEPTLQQVYSGGIAWDVDGSEMDASMAEYLAQQGVDPGEEAEINAFWNANRGNPNLTVEAVREWYRQRGIDVADADIARAIDLAMTPGVEFTGSGAEALQEDYRRQLDELIAARGRDPESAAGAVGISAAEGVFPLLDETAGVGGAVKALAQGGNPIAGYRVERDAVRREAERARTERPVTSTVANLAGATVTGAAPFKTASRLSRLASEARRLGNARAADLGRRAVASTARTGAGVGAFYGFGEGEGLVDSVTGAGVGSVAGAATGAAIEAVAPGVGKLANKVRYKGPAKETPAQRYAAGQKFGLDMSIGDARPMGSRVIERTLDAQPASAGIMDQSRQRLAGQIEGAVENVSGRFGPETSFRGMGEAAQEGARGWSARFDKVAERAYNAIPIKPDASATVSNTVSVLEELTTKITSNPRLAAMLTDKRLVGYLDALKGQTRQIDTGVVDMAGNPITRETAEGGSLSWADLKQLRSRIGEEIGEQIFGEGTLKSDLRRLYAALSSDMEATARAQGPKALRAFERANDLYKQGQERLESVWTALLGKAEDRTPEAAAATIQRIAREGRAGGDLAKLAEIRKTLTAEQWGQVANGFIRLMGQPANSAGREFSPATFVRVYADMADEAKNLLFGGQNKALRKNLDEFVGVIGNLAENDATRNTSRTAIGLGGTMSTGVGAAVGATLGGLPGALLGMALTHGAQYGAAKLWTNPGFVRWATGYAKMMRAASRSGRIDPKAHEGQMKALLRLAASNQVIAGEARALQQQLMDQFAAGPRALAAQGEDREETAGAAR